MKNILIVEDEENIVSLLTERLVGEGYTVLSCSSQGDALMKVVNQKFNCLVVDIHLKVGTGDRLIALLRKDPKGINYKTPILVISGHLHTDLVKKLAPDIDGVLVKPFELDQFIEKIKQLCD